MLQSFYLDLLGRSWNSTAATVTRQRYELVRPRPRLQTESHSKLVLSGILANRIKGAAKAIAKEHAMKGRQYMYAGAALVVANALLVLWIWRMRLRAPTTRPSCNLPIIVIFDILVSQCNVAFVIGYLIPRSVNTQIQGAREQVMRAAKTFWNEYRVQKFVSPQNMNVSVLAPDMDLYQQAEEEDKTELEVVQERESELRRLLDYHYYREHTGQKHRDMGHSKFNRTAREEMCIGSRPGTAGTTELMYRYESHDDESFMCEHPSSYMFVSDQLAKLHPTLFESGVVGSLDERWFEADHLKNEVETGWRWPV